MNIYVSNLDVKTTDENLKELFKPFGKVDSAKVVMDGFTGSSRGFGFVDMPDDKEGQKAIEHLNNSDFKELKLSVQLAKPMVERKGSYPARKKE